MPNRNGFTMINTSHQKPMFLFPLTDSLLESSEMGIFLLLHQQHDPLVPKHGRELILLARRNSKGEIRNAAIHVDPSIYFDRES